MPTLALLAWPVLTAIFFSNYRAPVAILLSIIGGYLLLPPAYDINFPLLPTFDKHNVAGVAALVCALIYLSKSATTQSLPSWIPRSIAVRILILFVLGAYFLSALSNMDLQMIGERIGRPMTIYDGFSGVLTSLMLLIPFLLGRKYMATPDAHRTILIALVIAAVIYSLPALFEVRMSPQLNRWIYGYFPHSWVQHIRGDGFRPVVFMGHGLLLSIFFAMAYLAALGCIRCLTGPMRLVAIFMAGWLLLTLFLSKSLGAMLIAMALTPVILFLGRRLQLAVLGVLAVVVLLYPMLRAVDVVPVDRVVAFAQTIDLKRSRSLNFRVETEDLILERAMERPLFGWGGKARWLPNDPNKRNNSVAAIPDGYWAILFGRAGWIGYIGQFGLLVGPILLVAWRGRKIDFSTETVMLSVVLLANVIDLIPNSSIVPITWLVAGALWGRLELGAMSDTVAEAVPDTPQKHAPVYSRGPQAGWSKVRGQPPDPADRERPAYSRFSPSAKR